MVVCFSWVSMNVQGLVPGLRQRQRERSAAIGARRREEARVAAAGGAKGKGKGKGKGTGTGDGNGNGDGRGVAPSGISVPVPSAASRGRRRTGSQGRWDRDRVVTVRVVRGAGGGAGLAEGDQRSGALARYDQAWVSTRRAWRGDEVPSDSSLLTCDERLLVSIDRLADVVPRARLARARLDEMRAGMALVDRVGADVVEEVDLPAARRLRAVAVEERAAAEDARKAWEFVGARQEAMAAYAHGRLLAAEELGEGDGPYRATKLTASERVQTDVATEARAWFRGNAEAARERGRRADEVAGAVEDTAHKLVSGHASMRAGVERQERSVAKWNEVERRLRAMRTRAVRESAGLGRLPAKARQGGADDNDNDHAGPPRLAYVSSIAGRDLVWPPEEAR